MDSELRIRTCRLYNDQPTHTSRGAQNYGSSFLPAVYQGTPVGQLGSDLKKATSNLKIAALATQSSLVVDLLQAMNRDLKAQQPTNQQIDGVIESYELAACKAPSPK